jgi:hypothetical protein
MPLTRLAFSDPLKPERMAPAGPKIARQVSNYDAPMPDETPMASKGARRWRVVLEIKSDPQADRPVGQCEIRRLLASTAQGDQLVLE